MCREIKSFFLTTMLTITMIISITNPLQAGDMERTTYPVQVQGMGVSFLGNGGSLGLHFTNTFYLGIEGFSNKYKGSESNVSDAGITETYDWEFKLSTSILVFRVSPFSESGFYLQLGRVNRTWRYVVDFVSEIGDSGQIGIGRGEVTWPSEANDIALGWAWIAAPGISWGLGLGLISGGAPTSKITLNDPVLQDSLQSDIKIEEDKLDKDLKKYSTIPYGYLHLGLNF